MGDPKKHRKKLKKPSHPWQKERILEEIELKKEFGLRNKSEIWKIGSVMKNFKDQAKKAVALTGKQAEKEKDQLLKRLQRYGLVKSSGSVDDVLGLGMKDVMERRLQTMVVKKGLANSIKQARQFITHGHITVADKKVTSPGFLVTVKDEGMIQFRVKSALSDADHPERFVKKKVPEATPEKKEEMTPEKKEEATPKKEKEIEEKKGSA